jgi:quinol monooxygenase YgiN
MAPVTVVGFLKFTDSKYKKELLAAISKLSDYVKESEEPGTVNFSYLQDADDPLLVLAVQEWQDENALGMHTTSDAFKTYFAVYCKLVDGGFMTHEQKTSTTKRVAGFGHR